jgi:hypothetical protein
MSRASQVKFLNDLQKKLLQSSSKYRQKRGDKQVHHFYASKKGIVRGIELTVSSKFKSKSDARIREILSIVDADINHAIQGIKDELKRLEAGETVAEVKITQMKPDAVGAVFYASKTATGRLRNIYRQAFIASNKYLKPLAEKVSAASIKVTGRSTGRKAKDYWHQEHGQNEGIAESLVRDAIEDSILDIPDISFNEAKEWLESIMPHITVIRNSKTNTMHVHVGPKVDNLAAGIKSRQAKKDFQEIVDDLVDIVNSDASFITDAPGSDSFTELEKKRILKAATDPFTQLKNKRTKVKTSSTKRKTSTSKVQTVGQSVAITHLASKKKAGTRGTNRRTKKSSMGFDQVKFLGALNRDLPDTVRKNMKEPGLVNRTGTFAESVKVTEITQTPQGFPSVGYTYKRDPYEVFEEGSGSKWANGYRDPRTLIDRSIREIATQFAIGRFYTRRQ